MIQKTQIRRLKKQEVLPVYDKKLCEEVEVEIHTLLTSAIVGGGSTFHALVAIHLVRGLHHPISR
jgi:hypothetical protein